LRYLIRKGACSARWPYSFLRSLSFADQGLYDNLWEAFAEELGVNPSRTTREGKPRTTREGKQLAKAVMTLLELGATVQEVHERCEQFRETHSGERFSGNKRKLTPRAVVDEWGTLGSQIEQNAKLSARFMTGEEFMAMFGEEKRKTTTPVRLEQPAPRRLPRQARRLDRGPRESLRSPSSTGSSTRTSSRRPPGPSGPTREDEVLTTMEFFEALGLTL
jgi:hypothetical protein